MAQDGGREKGDKSSSGKGDDYEFIPPDFDEDAFIHREIVSFRTTLILFVWGIVAALVSWGVFAAMHGARTGWLVGLVIVAVFGYSLRFLFPKLGADIKHFGRREWLGTAALFFFTWLAFFILAINPPVSDFAPPRVELHASPAVQEMDDAVTIDLFVEDNEKVAGHTFSLTLGSTTLATQDDLTQVAKGHYRYSAVGLTPGVYHLSASASDAHGHQSDTTLDFAVTEKILEVTLPADNLLDQPTDQVLVRALSDNPMFKPCTTKKGVVNNAPCVRTVQFQMTSGKAIDLEYSTTFGGWQATNNFAGWAQGNNTGSLVLQVVPTFAGSTKVGGGNVTAGPYTIQVPVVPGTYVPKVVAEPVAHQRSVPGLGLPALAVGLVAAALAVARRR